MNTNVVVLTGNMVRDIDLKFSQSGMAIAKGTIAVNGLKDDDVSYIDFTCFKHTAEATANYTAKGSKVALTGYIKQDKWTTKDGQNRSKLSVVANNIEFLTQKERSSKPNDVFEPTNDFDIDDIFGEE